MIIIHATFQIQADKEQAFLEEIRPLIAASKAELGNVAYDLMKDIEKENVYTMVEVWEDSAAVDIHNKSEHFTTFAGNAPQYFEAPLDVKLYDATEMQKM